MFTSKFTMYRLIPILLLSGCIQYGQIQVVCEEIYPARQEVLRNTLSEQDNISTKLILSIDNLDNKLEAACEAD